MTQIDLNKVGLWFRRNFFLMLTLVLAYYLFQTCKGQEIAVANYEAANQEISTYKLKNGQLASSVQALRLDKQQLESAIANNKPVKEIVEKFSGVKTVTQIVERIEIDSIEVPYAVPVPCKFQRFDSIKKPEYSFTYRSTEKGITLIDLQIPDSISVVTGDKKKWFLGKSRPYLDLTHTNPYVQTDKIQHFEFKQKTPFYKTTLFQFGAGFIAGALIVK